MIGDVDENPTFFWENPVGATFQSSVKFQSFVFYFLPLYYFNVFIEQSDLRGFDIHFSSSIEFLKSGEM